MGHMEGFRDLTFDVDWTDIRDMKDDSDEMYNAQKDYWNNTYYGLVGPKNERFMGEHLLKVLKGLDLKSISILDYGYGTGRLYRALGKPDNYVGVDISHTYLKRSKFFNKSKHPDIIYVDGRNLPLVNGVFDLVICYSVCTHLYIKQCEKLLRTLYNVIKPNGHILVTFFIKEGRIETKTNWVVLPEQDVLDVIDSVNLHIVDIQKVPENHSWEYQTVYLLRRSD